MKRYIPLLLIVLLCLSLSISVFAANSTVTLRDGANLLTQSEEDALQEKLENVSRTYNAQINIVTIQSVPDRDVYGYIEYFYDINNLGFGENRDGVLLVVCMDPRELVILSNGFAQDAIGDWEIEDIGDAIAPFLTDGDYYDAFVEFSDQCAYYLDGHINGFPFELGQNLAIALFIGLAAGLITALALKAQLKSVRKQDRAHAYVKSGSMQVTTARDLYLYRHVTRTKKETSSSSGSRSSGSRSSRSVGGRSF